MSSAGLRTRVSLLVGTSLQCPNVSPTESITIPHTPAHPSVLPHPRLGPPPRRPSQESAGCCAPSPSPPVLLAWIPLPLPTAAAAAASSVRAAPCAGFQLLFPSCPHLTCSPITGQSNLSKHSNLSRPLPCSGAFSGSPLPSTQKTTCLARSGSLHYLLQALLPLRPRFQTRHHESCLLPAPSELCACSFPLHNTPSPPPPNAASLTGQRLALPISDSVSALSLLSAWCSVNIWQMHK